jgi:hypothetical protein
MKPKSIYFVQDPGAPEAVPVYVTSNPQDPRAVLAYDVKDAFAAEVLAHRVEDRRTVVYLISSAL